MPVTLKVIRVAPALVSEAPEVSVVREGIALTEQSTDLGALLVQTRRPPLHARLAPRNPNEETPVVGGSPGSPPQQSGPAVVYEPIAAPAGSGASRKPKPAYSPHPFDPQPSGSGAPGSDAPAPTVILSPNQLDSTEFAFTDFGFDIPDNAIVTGLEILVLRSAYGNPSVEDAGEVVNC